MTHRPPAPMTGAAGCLRTQHYSLNQSCDSAYCVPPLAFRLHDSSFSLPAAAHCQHHATVTAMQLARGGEAPGSSCSGDNLSWHDLPAGLHAPLPGQPGTRPTGRSSGRCKEGEWSGVEWSVGPAEWSVVSRVLQLAHCTNLQSCTAHTRKHPQQACWQYLTSGNPGATRDVRNWAKGLTGHVAGV